MIVVVDLNLNYRYWWVQPQSRTLTEPQRPDQSDIYHGIVNLVAEVWLQLVPGLKRKAEETAGW